MLTRILQRRLFNSAAPVLLYSSDFGSAALPAGCTEEAAGVYEREHRIKEGELGLAPGQNALLAGRGMCIAATAPPASQPLATVLADLTTVAPEILPVFSTLETSDADPKVHPYPTTRFKEGTLVVAVGHNDLDKVSNISPGVITEVCTNNLSKKKRNTNPSCRKRWMRTHSRRRQQTCNRGRSLCLWKTPHGYAGWCWRVGSF